MACAWSCTAPVGRAGAGDTVAAHDDGDKHIPAIARIVMRASAGFLVVLALGTAGLTAARATDRAGFCRSCHEMTPYHDAWSEGPHAGVECVACHVDPGTAARLEHKFVALAEVRAHFAGDPVFPLATAPVVPDARCIACHADVETSRTAGFSHETHTARGPCVRCHSTAGHEVATAALAAAGIWSGRAPAASATATGPAPGRGSADVTGHVKVGCTSCHTLSELRCSDCHDPRHPSRGECTTCHAPGAAFVFTHPKDTSCEKCHKTPDPTHAKGARCAACHPEPASWKFAHPTTGMCESCHARPSGHRAGACTSCHGVGTSWAFRHPGAGSACASCHARPAGHRAGACTSCHSVGARWAFRHPSSTGCSSCHKAPGGHYGSSCVSCHSASRAWSSATFRHPSVRGGEHTYRSFPCASCHPRGYGSTDCNTCHARNGEDDD
ncbi:MAG: hypothetical protein FDZ70_09855 [Actinobacteria bacterium]|nr:MAG: hypothetical protein FDZ70_09855 [Actinomycetota bacterium]